MHRAYHEAVGLKKAPSGTKPEGADWAEVFTTLISHTSLHYHEIKRLTIPQIEAILSKLGRHISLKIGVPVSSASEVAPDRPPTLSEIANFCGGFTDK